jgi:hypothetical protein
MNFLSVWYQKLHNSIPAGVYSRSITIFSIQTVVFWIATLEVDTNVSEEYAASIFRVEVSVVRIRSELARIHASERGDSPVQANALQP